MNKLSRTTFLSLVGIILITIIIFGYPFTSSVIWNARQNFAEKNQCELEPTTSPFSFYPLTIYKCEGNTELENKINNSSLRHDNIDVFYWLGLLILLPISLILVVTFLYSIVFRKN